MIRKILDTVLFDGYTTQEIFVLAAVVIVVLTLSRRVLRLLRRPESSQYFQSVECPNCGWRGKVSRLAGRCPKCGEPLGEQKARIK